MIQRYMGKISGPLLDRIDIHIDVPAVNYKELRAGNEPESSGKIREGWCALGKFSCKDSRHHARGSTAMRKWRRATSVLPVTSPPTASACWSAP